MSTHNGGSVNDVNIYRGISLLSHLGKLFCRICISRLRDWANRENLMFEKQGGFTKGKGTIEKKRRLMICYQVLHVLLSVVKKCIVRADVLEILLYSP